MNVIEGRMNESEKGLSVKRIEGFCRLRKGNERDYLKENEYLVEVFHTVNGEKRKIFDYDSDRVSLIEEGLVNEQELNMIDEGKIDMPITYDDGTLHGKLIKCCEGQICKKMDGHAEIAPNPKKGIVELEIHHENGNEEHTVVYEYELQPGNAIKNGWLSQEEYDKLEFENM